MDKALKEKIKHDKFVEVVEQATVYAGSHQQQMLRYAGAALAVLVAVAGIYWFTQSRKESRQAALREVFAAREATVGPTPQNGALKAYPTQAEKDKAIQAAIAAVVSNYGGSEEANFAKYIQGSVAADQGKVADAKKIYAEVANVGGNSGSLAKFALASMQASDGNTAEAEKLFRELLANPTPVVSKEQATIALARAIGKQNPGEARKLLEPLRTARAQISRNAIAALGELPPVPPPAQIPVKTK